ncbi:hypothetical protein ACFQNE_03055 [Gordonia phosphorivorans]|uniref:DUF3105 domain-containing protein n=1 Tax=Gordonia phosphorivorans TaxID=1056982 RepID=A0ABV6H3X7_9ACTN
MLDKIRDLTDRIPRPGELDARGRIFAGVAGIAVLAVVVVLALWGAGVFGGSSSTEAEEGDGLPYGMGVVECGYLNEDPTDVEYELGAALSGGEKGLPYKGSPGGVVDFVDDETRIVTIWLCMEPDATQEQITDVSTVMARNIKANFADQADIDALVVRYLGTGGLPLKDLTTYWQEQTFSSDVPVADQRSAWEWDDDPSNPS